MGDAPIIGDYGVIDMAHEWRFPCRLISNYDGDTFDLAIDLGFEIQTRHSIRLSGVDTPELRGGTDESKAAARLARDVANAFVNSGEEVIFVSEQWAGKYGRPLGDIVVDGLSLRDHLLDQRLGVPYSGGSRETLRTQHMANIAWLRDREQI